MTATPASIGPVESGAAAADAAQPACCARGKAPTSCFQCGEPVDPQVGIQVEVAGQQRAFCCHGCQSAAEFIEQQNLGDFYRRRDFSTPSGDQQRAARSTADWTFLDNQTLAEPYVVSDESARQLTLRVQGMYCNSCSWLIKQSVQKLSSDIECAIDVDQQRVDLLVADSGIKLSDVLQQIANLGYQVDPQRSNQIDHGIEARRQQSRQALQRIAVAGFGMMQVMTYAVAVYFGQFDGMQGSLRQFLELISMLVATGVVFYSGAPFFNNAINDLSHRRLGMDVPIALAIGGAYFPSVWEVLVRDSGFVYFDSAVMFIFFLSVGRYVETRARQRFASTPMDLQSALPHYVEVDRQNASGSETLTLAPSDIRRADQLWLASGELVVADGEIVTGQGVFDEASLTGEATPLVKQSGDQVIAGTRMLSGRVKVQVRHAFADSYLARIDQLLRRASLHSGDDRALVEKTVRHFIAGVLILTVAVATVWWFIAPERVFQIVLAMLVASCPCAFALARPIGLTAASAALRKRGVLLAEFGALQELAQVSCWAFDKTGTLTVGQPQITDIKTYSKLDAAQCLAIAGALEMDSQHVLAVAFADVGNSMQAIRVESYPGLGVAGTVEGRDYRLGKRDWINDWIANSSVTTDKPLDVIDQSEVVLANEQGILAVFTLNDRLRPQAATALAALSEQGAEIEVWSGDRQAVTEKALMDLPIQRVIGDLLPDQKVQQVERLQAAGKTVAMVGDGLNDAPVMAQADVAIAMVQGAQISQSQAQLILLGGRLSSLADALRIARKTVRLETQNLRWALAYNVLVLPLAAAGFLAPWLAALGMSASSLLVVMNALRVGSQTATQAAKPARQDQPEAGVGAP